MQHKKFAVNALLLSFMLSLLTVGVFTSEAATFTHEEKPSDWVNNTNVVMGGWSIEKIGSQHVLSFSNKFKTKSGADLATFLSPQLMNVMNSENLADMADAAQPATGTSKFNSLLLLSETYSAVWNDKSTETL